jgi:serine/threonine protein kinase
MVESRRNKIYKRKRRRSGGSKQFRGSEVTNLDEKYRGKNFFRKYGASTVEHAIYTILKENPHPNIVKVYRITDSYIDIELLTPIVSEKDYDKNTLVSEALLAKNHLQSLGIMYIDWKPDNIGIGADGKYKLFDFDLSGITNSNGKKWEEYPATYSWSYRQAIANGLKDPKEIDDFAFEINFIREDYVELND